MKRETNSWDIGGKGVGNVGEMGTHSWDTGKIGVKVGGRGWLRPLCCPLDDLLFLKSPFSTFTNYFLSLLLDSDS